MEGYFRQQRHGDVRADRLTVAFKDFADRQPWFKWNRVTTSYDLQASGAQLQLLSYLHTTSGPNVRLYRGLSDRQAEILYIAKDLLHAPSDRGATTEIGKRILALSEQYKQNPTAATGFRNLAERVNHGLVLSERRELVRDLLAIRFANEVPGSAAESFFTTPNKGSAQGYGKVIQASIPMDRLVQLSQNHGCFVGLEYYFYEIMFYGFQGIEVFLDGMD